MSMSSLDFSKKIDAATATRLRTLLQRLDFLNNLQEPAFFQQDFLAKTYVWKAKDRSVRSLIFQDIGPLQLPAYGLVSSIFCDNFYTHLDNRKPLEKVAFQIMLTEAKDRHNGSDINISVTPQASQEKVNSYSFNPRFRFDKNIFLATANYFYNKLPLYKKSYASLLENKKTLTKTLGASFTEDLLLLFSAEPEQLSVAEYTVPKVETTKIQVYHAFPSWCKKLGLAVIPLYMNGYIWLDVFVELNLTAEKTLDFSVRLDKDTLHPEIRKCDLASGNISKGELLELIEEQLNDWLKNTEQMLNFGYSIFDKFKPKILVEKI